MNTKGTLQAVQRVLLCRQCSNCCCACTLSGRTLKNQRLWPAVCSAQGVLTPLPSQCARACSRAGARSTAAYQIMLAPACCGLCLMLQVTAGILMGIIVSMIVTAAIPHGERVLMVCGMSACTGLSAQHACSRVPFPVAECARLATGTCVATGPAILQRQPLAVADVVVAAAGCRCLAALGLAHPFPGCVPDSSSRPHAALPHA